MRTSHGRDWLLVAGACLLTACASDAQKCSAALDAAQSWLATVDMVSHVWMLIRVPTRYARQTLKEARSQLESGGETIAQLDVDRGLRRQATSELHAAAQATDTILAAVGRDDARAVAMHLHAIGGHLAAVDSLASSAKRASQ